MYRAETMHDVSQVMCSSCQFWHLQPSCLTLQGWKGLARALLTESAQQRDDNNNGLTRELSELV